jgi:hypothetical protein
MEVVKGFKFVIMHAFLSKSNGVRRILHPIRERKIKKLGIFISVVTIPQPRERKKINKPLMANVMNTFCRLKCCNKII